MPGPLRVIDIVDLEETIQRIVSDILERPTFTVVNAQLAVRDQAIAQRALASDIDTEFAARDIAIAARALAVDLQAGLSVRPTITTVNAELAARDVAISARALVSELSAAVTDLTTAINARALAADVTSGFAARPPMIVRQTTQDYVRDVTALADIPELGFAAEANRRYGFILLALYQSAAVGTGVSLSM
ncbi:MAG TPA: hypothetical protein VEA38_16600, partial [Terriglobales bacterium]|nr:hypothetical protein [Terriglobales bacterium]